ncbi:hypothetical protein HPP92_021722 [Vanilla planifolia]|uniref:Uncharacterized protein n=1 Tax=Vanilla planifolia TaxID=51239 RepID=A0A835Q5K0_VANPL|nr:hypothetical protein HPP92_022039 [Vanilla planifolia]KAG0463246.1 hypothetical protein HPP92_021722 [Vanilla planifolia]
MAYNEIHGHLLEGAGGLNTNNTMYPLELEILPIQQGAIDHVGCHNANPKIPNYIMQPWKIGKLLYHFNNGNIFNSLSIIVKVTVFISYNFETKSTAQMNNEAHGVCFLSLLKRPSPLMMVITWVVIQQFLTIGDFIAVPQTFFEDRRI